MAVTVKLTYGAELTAQERLTYVSRAMQRHKLLHSELAFYTGYSLSMVRAWLSDPGSPRFREVPARAVDRLRLELDQNNVKGSK